MSVTVTSSKLSAERINDLALRFGATRSHVYPLGDIEMVSAFENSRTANHDTDDRQLRIDQLAA